eukprot:COSAG02_NODE_11243_length_1762_cov_1.579675_1_plen_37_part_10
MIRTGTIIGINMNGSIYHRCGTAAAGETNVKPESAFF